MKSSIILAALFSFALGSPLVARDDCTCDFICLTQVGPDCECELYNKNECYKVQLADGRKCPAPKLTSECASRMKVGRKGDKCLQFTSPPQPPCGPGLTCVKKESLITDQGGICQPITAPKPGAKPKEGDACTFGPGQPKMCGESLTCDLEVGQSPCINPDGPCPGVCQIEFHILPIEE